MTDASSRLFHIGKLGIFQSSPVEPVKLRTQFWYACLIYPWKVGPSWTLSATQPKMKLYEALPLHRIPCHFETPDMHFAIIAKLSFVFGLTDGCRQRLSTHNIGAPSQQSAITTTRLSPNPHIFPAINDAASISLRQHCTPKAHDAKGRPGTLPSVQTSPGATKPHLLLRNKSERIKREATRA